MTIQDVSMQVERETLELSIRAAKTLDKGDLAAAFAAKCVAWERKAAVLVGMVEGMAALLASQDAILDAYEDAALPADDGIADDPWIVDLGAGLYEFDVNADIIARERAGRDQ
jgi:hypothetical protein